MKFTELKISPGRYLALDGRVVEILSVSGTAACGRYLGHYSINTWHTNGWFDVLGGSRRDLVARLPIDVETDKLAAVIRGVWRCLNGQFVTVKDVGAEYATGVSVEATEMRWGTFTGIAHGIDCGWDLEAWLGFAPEKEGEE